MPQTNWNDIKKSGDARRKETAEKPKGKGKGKGK